MLSATEETVGWRVNLKGNRVDSSSVITGTEASGGGSSGSWSGTFHGKTPVTDDDANARVAPGAVVGEFNANFSNGTAAGGFGARKK